MGDAVTSRTLMEDRNFLIMQFTNISDSTGESDVKKVDVSALTPACGSVKINKVYYNVIGMAVAIEFDATTDTVACVVQGTGVTDYRAICGGVTNDAGAAVTGDVFFTTTGHSAGDSYNIILEMEKVGPV